MRSRQFITACVVACASFAVPLMAMAGPADDIRGLIKSGDYTKALTLASDIETAEGYILAAESLSAQIMLGEVDKLNKSAKRARKFAKMALELDPSSYDARLQYALAEGFVTRTTGNLTAWRKRLPMKSRKTIQNLRADYPQDARVMALEAAWHLGVIRKTGESSGQKWFGASTANGHNLYQAAIARAPQDIIIRTNYIMGLLALKAEPDAALIKTHLDALMLMVPQTDAEMKVKNHASLVHASLTDMDLAKTQAEQFLDGK